MTIKRLRKRAIKANSAARGMMELKDDMSRTTPVSVHSSRPASRNAFNDNHDSLGDAELAHLLSSSDPIIATSNTQSSSAAPASSYSYAAALGASLSRNSTPDLQRVARAPSPSLTPIGGGRVGNSETRNINSPNNSFHGVSIQANESSDLVTALSGMDISNGAVNGENQNHLSARIEQEAEDHKNYLYSNLQGGQNNTKHQNYMMHETGHFNMPSETVPSSNSYMKGPSNVSVNQRTHYQQISFWILILFLF